MVCALILKLKPLLLITGYTCSASSEENDETQCSEEGVSSTSYNRLEEVNDQSNNHIVENIVSHQPLKS